MADSPFIEDAGPGFDPDAAAAGADQVRAAEDAAAREVGVEAYPGLPPVTEEQVHSVLFTAGDGVHAVAGVGEYDWVMTQRDLDRIAPPLTRVLNRYDAAKVAAAYSDEFALLMGVGLYGWRSMLERVAVLRAQDESSEGPPRAPRPVAPAPPPPGRPPAPEPSPAPAPPPAPVAAPAGGAPEPFPGAGAPPDLAPMRFEVAPGYTTHADRIRQARERKPDAVPAEAPPASL